MDWRSVVGFGDVGVVSGVAMWRCSDVAVSNYFDFSFTAICLGFGDYPKGLYSTNPLQSFKLF